MENDSGARVGTQHTFQHSENGFIKCLFFDAERKKKSRFQKHELPLCCTCNLDDKIGQWHFIIRCHNK